MLRGEREREIWGPFFLSFLFFSSSLLFIMDPFDNIHNRFTQCTKYIYDSSSVIPYLLSPFHNLQREPHSQSSVFFGHNVHINKKKKKNIKISRPPSHPLITIHHFLQALCIKSFPFIFKPRFVFKLGSIYTQIPFF